MHQQDTNVFPGLRLNFFSGFIHLEKIKMSLKLAFKAFDSPHVGKKNSEEKSSDSLKNLRIEDATVVDWSLRIN